MLLRYVFQLTENVNNIAFNCIYNNSAQGLQIKQNTTLHKGISNNLKYLNIHLPKIEIKYSITIPFWTLNRLKYNHCHTEFPKIISPLELYLQKFIEHQN